MRYTVTLFVGLVCLVMLVGCGGGGGGGLQMAQPLQPSEPVQPVEPTVPEEPTEPEPVPEHEVVTEPEPTPPGMTDEERASLAALEAAREELRREGVSEGCIEQPELCDLASVLDTFRPTMTTTDGRQAPISFTTETPEHGPAVSKLNVGFPRMDATHEQLSDYLENQVSRTGTGVSFCDCASALFFRKSGPYSCRCDRPCCANHQRQPPLLVSDTSSRRAHGGGVASRRSSVWRDLCGRESQS